MPQGKKVKKAQSKNVKTRPAQKNPAQKPAKTAPPPKPKGAVVLYTVINPTADILKNPDDELNVGQHDSQLLFGEGFKAATKTKGWLYGVSVNDGYEGYVHESTLQPEKLKPTHIVEKPLLQVYKRPDFKTRPFMTLSFMSRIYVESGPGQNGFVKITNLGWVFKTHLRKISDLRENMDPLLGALKFLGTPYLYGGRSTLGVDCSGLVQAAMQYCAIPCPRDSDQQIEIGKPITTENIQRGDLVFFKGHVGIMIDRSHVLNATARTMDTRIERLEELAGIYKGIIAIRRVTR